jgi:hypothetical protein
MPRKRQREREGRAPRQAAAMPSVAPRAAKAQRATRRSSYAWHRRVPWVAVGAIAVVLVAGVLIARQLGVGETAGRYVAGGGVGQHVPAGQSITYPSYPPTSGQHSDSPASWGFHTEPVVDELAVHNLEHGGVVVSQNNISADDLSKLRALLTSYPKDQYGEVKLLIRPYDKITPGTIVLTAWNWVDELTAYDEARVKAFMDAHLNKCCESVR